MERQVSHTVYSLLGVTPIIEDLDEQVIRPLNFLRYGIGPPDTPPAPKMIIISGKKGQGHRSICSALVNELRRGRSNKRGDVHYKNRDVKYREWEFQTDTLDCLTRVLEQAKYHEFTVITIHRFEGISLFLNLDNAEARTRSSQDAAAVKRVLMAHLNSAVAGKVLLVLTTSNESMCDTDVVGKADYKYHIPLPDAQVREEIIWKMLENEDVTLTPFSLMDTLIHSTRNNFTIEDIVYVVNGAVRLARGRLREQQENGSSQTRVKVIRDDFSRFLDMIYEGRVLQQRQEDDSEEEEEEEEESEEEDDEEARYQLARQEPEGPPFAVGLVANVDNAVLPGVPERAHPFLENRGEAAAENEEDGDGDELEDDDQEVEVENEDEVVVDEEDEGEAEDDEVDEDSEDEVEDGEIEDEDNEAENENADVENGEEDE